MTPSSADFEPHLKFPVFDIPQKEWRPKTISWEAVIDETEWSREYYLKHFDSPEKRLRSKNPKPFVLD
jgi:hypothetical protein